MNINLLERAFAQKGVPLPGAALCANCGRPHQDHHPYGACPLADGSGYSLDRHFRRQGAES